MNNTKKLLVLLFTSAVLAGGLCACDRSNETPGEQLDNALDKAGDKVKEAGDAIKPNR